jgi:glucans biosynthesis protein
VPDESLRSRLSRRAAIGAGLGVSAAALLGPRPLLAQAPPPPPPPSGPAPSARFGYDDVVRRAQELAQLPYDPAPPPLPEELQNLTFDQFRDIRFRSERALLGAGGSPFRMQMFHLGFLFRRPVVVNVIRDGIATPVPYSPTLFDYGATKFQRPLPVDLGFAGFRLHYPINDPRVADELISFLGASYFRFLGRNQRYGLSGRGVAIDSGGPNPEEFPVFREFWVEMPIGNAGSCTMYAVLEGPSLTGAYQFVIYPENETVLDVNITLFIRKPIAKLGIAPLTSMFQYAENDRRHFDNFRPEVHDSDGLLVHLSSGEWIWRPLRNPRRPEGAVFLDNNVRGFGLMQRDRLFEHYQDLDLAYERRPSYWVEPHNGWGEGRIELVELPTEDETNDNVVAFWVPRAPVEAGQRLAFGYRIRALANETRLHTGGRAINTYQTRAAALGSAEPVTPGSRRFIIDFAGGELPYYLNDPSIVTLVPSASSGQIKKTFVVPNPKIGGFRVGIDFQGEPGRSSDLRAFLRSGDRALTETWTFPWTPEG